jgi:hypothetical protein
MNESRLTASSDTPIVFLGLCERARYVREGNTNLFKWNILGLKTVVLSHIFPLTIGGWAAGFAIPQGASETEARLRITDGGGQEVGTLSLFTSAAEPDDQSGVFQGEVATLLVPEHGWTTVFVPLKKTAWVIPAPGVYYLEQSTIRGPVRIGTLQFAFLEAPQLSAERIAAIKSDPNASKAVRVEVGCKYCPSKFRAYAALDRNDKMESEGWNWYQDIPDVFECECGKNTTDLQYIRRNLHGLLGRRHRNTEQLSFMPLYEKSSLESIRVNFADLIAKKPREEVLQQFLEENPILLHQFPAERIIAKPPILTSYYADFGIVTPQKELILVELEKTTTRLMKKNGDIAAPLSHAFDQVRNWLHEVDEHRLAVLDSLQIERGAVSVIRGIVIAGRDGGYDARDLRRLKGADYGRVAFLSYDDILFALDALMRRVEES